MKNYYKPRYSKILLQFAFCLLLIANCKLIIAQNPRTNSKVYSIEEAIKQALENNGSIKTASLQIEYQKKIKNSSWDFGQTSLDYTYGQTNSLAKDNNITISQSIPSIGTNIRQTKLAKAYLQNSEINLSMTKAEVVNNVKANYYNLAYHYSKLKLLKYQDSLYTNFFKAAELKADKGESTVLEKITAQTQLMEVKTMLNQTLSDIQLYQKKLQILLNEKQAISITDQELKKAEFTIAADSSVMASNPALAIMQQQIIINKLETKIEKSKFIPEFSFGYFNQSNKDVKNDYRFSGIQFGLSVPLLFFSQSAKIKASKINELIAQNNWEYFRTVIAGEFETLLQEYNKFKTNLEYYEKTALPQSELIIQQSEKSYKSGNIDYVEYVLNLDKAIAIKTNYLLTLNDHNQSIFAIEKIIGKVN